MTYAFMLALVAAVFGIPYLWREHRLEFWCWLSWKAGTRAGLLVEEERQRRQAALCGESLLEEMSARWHA